MRPIKWTKQNNQSVIDTGADPENIEQGANAMKYQSEGGANLS